MFYRIRIRLMNKSLAIVIENRLKTVIIVNRILLIKLVLQLDVGDTEFFVLNITMSNERFSISSFAERKLAHCHKS